MNPHHPASRCLAAALLLVAVAGCSLPPPEAAGFGYTIPSMPEGASGYAEKPGWAARRLMVAAANPLATDAGYQVLRAGGSAVDAAVAVQMVLALVEPQASGIGGGAFLMHWDGATVAAWDGRETAPAATDDKLLLRPDGTPMPLADAAVGGRAVGVPGAVRMLEAAHRRHGRLPWSRLLEPAIALAEHGFPVGARMHALLKSETALRQDPQARAYFYRADGDPHPVGHLLRNPALAAVLQAIAQRGGDALHAGPIAQDIVARVRRHPTNPGRMSEADMAAYQPRLRAPICTNWKIRYRVCGFPPPSSGHLAVMQILGLLEHAPAVPSPLVEGIPGADWLHIYAEAARLAYADRAQYVADPDFVDAPGGDWRSLLDQAYLRERARLIGPKRMKAVAPGEPGAWRSAWAVQPEQPEFGTSHISIVDAAGRAVALTSTIEAAWGARLLSDGGTGLAGGFLLNNQLTDFSATPADAEGRPIANRVQPGKRPRSSMSPTLVFDAGNGQLVMSLGSPLGAVIPHLVAKTLIASLDWGLNVQQAISLPNFGVLDGPALLETNRFPHATIEALRARGHTVIERDIPSGLQAIQRTREGWFGGADPRREGVVMGD